MSIQSLRSKLIIQLLSLLVPSGYAIFVTITAPLGTALQFGGDEGYELMKGLLLSRGFILYSEIWSDQPPLHTALLAFLFKLFGPSVLAARLLSVGFAALALWSIYELIRSRSGMIAGLVGTGLLAASPHFLKLSVSAMIVLPAMAPGLFSVWIFFQHRFGSKRRILIFSGVAMGLALQIKYAAVLFVPAMIVELFMQHHRADEGRPLISRKFFWDALAWGAGGALAFGAVWMLFPAANSDLLLGTHFSEQTRRAFSSHDSFAQFHAELWRQLGAVTMAAAGLVWILRRRLWNLLFPVVLLITVYVFHCFHRPYWYFHYLHFAIPLAWLSAIALKEFAVYFLKAKPRQFFRPPYTGVVLYLLWAGATALLLSDLVSNATRGWASITAVRRVDQDPLVQELRRHADWAKFAVVDRSIDAFHAGIAVPPPLAVVSQKRVRSGRFGPEDMLATIIQYEPELVALRRQGEHDSELKSYLSRHYDPIPGSDLDYLLIRRDLMENKPGF